MGSWFNGGAYVIILVNLLVSAWKGEKASANPWNALSLEWQTSSPPPTTNFVEIPTFPDDVYDYGTEGRPAEKPAAEREVG